MAKAVTDLAPDTYQTASLAVAYCKSKLLRESAHLGMGFPLRCFQRLSTPHMATRHMPLAEQPVHQRCVLTGPLVLGEDSLNALTLTSDMDQTVSRRSEPSSRTTLMGEQPNPCDVLPPQDVTHVIPMFPWA